METINKSVIFFFAMNPKARFSGSLVDFNDETLTDQEKAFATAWMEGKLGTPLGEAPIRNRYQSPDQQTAVTIYDVSLGRENDRWYLSRWQNQGEQPSFVLWSEEMYDEQVANGYTEITEDKA